MPVFVSQVLFQSVGSGTGRERGFKHREKLFDYTLLLLAWSLTTNTHTHTHTLEFGWN